MPWSDFITSPTSYRSNLESLTGIVTRSQYAISDNAGRFEALQGVGAVSSQPNFGHLTLLVFEAVLEVVCVSLPGYIVARTGMFDAEAQKFVANLNVMLFTPCMIFTKLAGQLTADKMADLAIIPVIFLIQTTITFSAAWIVSTIFRFKKRQRSFVIAMGIFGNSNSLPISLVVSLSKTLSGLHWDKIPGDNDDEVAARGILYLVIFQQLGQLLRWTWGYNVLLAPADRFTEEQGGTARAAGIERGRDSYRDDPNEFPHERLISPARDDGYESNFDESSTRVDNSPATSRAKSPHGVGNSRMISDESLPANGYVTPNTLERNLKQYDEDAGGLEGLTNKVRNRVQSFKSVSSERVSKGSESALRFLPLFLQKALRATGKFLAKFLTGIWAFMNPPLWAMLTAIFVASIPKLQGLFFNNGSFLRNSVTRALEQNGAVAVPLILVVLGGNLARNTIPKSDRPETEDPTLERKLLIAAIICRMVIPTICMTPILALMAKYVHVSILDDKIFIVVCFLLTGAPSALQLAQICQINNVYMGVMSKILFQSYVIWIMPSTLTLVLLALTTVTWAEAAA